MILEMVHWLESIKSIEICLWHNRSQSRICEIIHHCFIMLLCFIILLIMKYIQSESDIISSSSINEVNKHLNKSLLSHSMNHQPIIAYHSHNTHQNNFTLKKYRSLSESVKLKRPTVRLLVHDKVNNINHIDFSRYIQINDHIC